MARATLEIALELVTITCCHNGCGITFAVPTWWEQSRRTDHQWWYCPSGHSQHFSGDTKEQQRVKELEQALATERSRRKWHEERGDRLANDNMDLANSNRALKGVATKLKKRAAAGVCPACNRTISQMARHMKSKHPNFHTNA